MTDCNQKIKNALESFNKHLDQTNPELPEWCEEQDELPMQAVLEQNKKNLLWEPWCKDIGIYYFAKGTEILYIGQTMASFGSRIAAHISPTQDGGWLNDIGKESQLGLIRVSPKSEYIFFIPALEVYLIQKIAPKYNIQHKN